LLKALSTGAFSEVQEHLKDYRQAMLALVNAHKPINELLSTILIL
jgi:hypothetical protein